MIMKDCKDRYESNTKGDNHATFVSALWQVAILVTWFYAFYITFN